MIAFWPTEAYHDENRITDARTGCRFVLKPLCRQTNPGWAGAIFIHSYGYFVAYWRDVLHPLTMNLYVTGLGIPG